MCIRDSYYTDVKQYEQHAGQTIPAGSEVPSQSATTLQSDWFWKLEYPSQELRSAKQIVEEWLIPFNAHHCNLILNVAPNREGRFDQNAMDRLAEIGQLWRDRMPAPRLTPALQIISSNLASGRPSYASSSADTSGPDLANDDRPGTYWPVSYTHLDVYKRQPLQLQRCRGSRLHSIVRNRG